jgi:hypothetical protein
MRQQVPFPKPISNRIHKRYVLNTTTITTPFTINRWQCDRDGGLCRNHMRQARGQKDAFSVVTQGTVHW